MKNDYTVAINPRFNSYEITFAEKPDQTVIDALKAARFRWCRRGFWYGYTDPAQILGGSTPAEQPKKAEKIDLSNLGGKMPAHGTELAQIMREELKRRGATGCTVRTRKGYTDAYDVTVTISPEELRSVEAVALRYSLPEFLYDSCNGAYIDGKWVRDLNERPEEEQEAARLSFIRASFVSQDFHGTISAKSSRILTPSALERLEAVRRICNQWNYDNSDIMTDYFDVGYYLTISTKLPKNYKPTEEATEAERAEYAAEIEAQQAEQARRLEEYEEAKKEAEARREEEKKLYASIIENVTVHDIAENEVYTVHNLRNPNLNKLSSLEEYKKTLPEYGYTLTDAQITREISFTSEDAFRAFSRCFLTDFDFLAGKGGSATDDPRVTCMEDFSKMTKEERETVVWYCCNCVAIYAGGMLQYVIDPQGHSYARYVLTRDDLTVIDTEEAEEPAEEPTEAPAELQPVAVELVKESEPDPELVHALPVDVFRTHSLNGCSNGGISEKYDRLYIICDRGPVTLDAHNLPENAVHVVNNCLEPVARPAGYGWMAGGSFAHTSDSRFAELFGGLGLPVSIHDRTESLKQYLSND